MTDTNASSTTVQGEVKPQFEPSTFVEYGSVADLTQLGGPFTGGPDAGAYS